MSAKILTIKDIKAFLDGELKDSFYDDAEISSLARIIIKTIFKGAGLHQIYNSRARLSEEQSLIVREICKELKTGKPYQYIIGETEFCSCRIKVKPGVLIPRPETEELADLIIRTNKGFRGAIADLGTGSGCIAIALASGIPDSIVTGYDISEEALKIAAENASLNNTTVRFVQFDILKPDKQLPPAGMIVSNPPYVLNSERTHMRKNVLDFEPPAALFVDDSDPLIFYRKIADISRESLLKSGQLYLEINERMAGEIKLLLAGSGFSEITIIRDLFDKNRFVKAIKS